MTIKYSIVLPYIDRLYQLEKTLKTFVTLYGRSDFEVIVVEDSKNPSSGELALLVGLFRKWLNINHIKHFGQNTNPSPLYNQGVRRSFGKYIILSSPECYHSVDILKGLDEEFGKNENAYVVCSCQNLNANDMPISWFQHSEYRNALYHFCTAISAEQYKNIGGFDEEFATGYCFDDDDLKANILKSNLNVVTRDDLMVCHQYHSKNYPRNKKLWLKNKALYESKHGKYIEPCVPSKI